MILRPRYKKIKTTSKYRSGLEEQIATQLKLKNIKFEYETKTLKYTKPEKVHRYTPDFILIKKSGEPMYIEGKGRFLTVDKQKSLLVLKSFIPYGQLFMQKLTLQIKFESDSGLDGEQDFEQIEKLMV